MFPHEASIIATKERAKMKMIEFFIARKIVVDGAGHSNEAVRVDSGERRDRHRRVRLLMKQENPREFAALSSYILLTILPSHDVIDDCCECIAAKESSDG